MRRRHRKAPNSIVVALVCFAVGIGAMLLVGQRPTVASPAPVPSTADMVDADFALCAHRHVATCVIDGDTLRVGGERVRLADIDAPEVFSPKCASEKALGDRATRRLIALVNGGPFALEAQGRDRDLYGRKLRLAVRDGRSLGAELVVEGLARVWDGKRHPWCNGVAG